MTITEELRAVLTGARIDVRDIRLIEGKPRGTITIIVSVYDYTFEDIGVATHVETHDISTPDIIIQARFIEKLKSFRLKNSKKKLREIRHGQNG